MDWVNRPSRTTVCVRTRNEQDKEMLETVTHTALISSSSSSSSSSSTPPRNDDKSLRTDELAIQAVAEDGQAMVASRHHELLSACDDALPSIQVRAPRAMQWKCIRKFNDENSKILIPSLCLCLSPLCLCLCLSVSPCLTLPDCEINRRQADG